MSNQDDTETLLEDVMNRSEKLSEWETGFIENIYEYWSSHGSLTPQQYHKLCEVWERVT